MGAGPSSSIQTRSPNLRPWMSRGSEMYRWAATKGRSLGLRAGDGAEFLTVRCQKRRPLGLRGVRSAHARPMQRRQHPLAAGLHAGSRQHLRHALRCLLVGRQLQVVLVALNHLGQGRPARGVGGGGAARPHPPGRHNLQPLAQVLGRLQDPQVLRCAALLLPRSAALLRLLCLLRTQVLAPQRDLGRQGKGHGRDPPGVLAVGVAQGGGHAPLLGDAEGACGARHLSVVREPGCVEGWLHPVRAQSGLEQWWGRQGVSWTRRHHGPRCSAVRRCGGS